MLKVTATALLAAMLLGTYSGGAFAHSVSQIQTKQAAKIEEGRRDGSITYSEGRKLRKQQAEIAALEKKLKADDGRLDRAEREVLKKLLRDSRREIRKQQSNGLKRWSALPRVGR